MKAMDSDNAPFAEGWLYRKPNCHTLSILEDLQVMFSNPNQFNDPFDCQRNIIAIYDEVVAIHGADFKALMDPIMELYSRERSKHSSFVFCLTKEWRNQLMWAHYAKSHQGIALGFTFEADSNFRPTELERYDVQYNNEIIKESLKELGKLKKELGHEPSESLFFPANNSSQYLEKLLGFFDEIKKTKSEEWNYEKEFRYVLEREKSNDNRIPRGFSPQDLKYVILGNRCLPEFKNDVVRLLRSERMRHVKIWQVELNHIYSSLELTPVDRW